MKKITTVLILIIGMNFFFQHQQVLYGQTMEHGYAIYLMDSTREESRAKTDNVTKATDTSLVRQSIIVHTKEQRISKNKDGLTVVSDDYQSPQDVTKIDDASNSITGASENNLHQLSTFTLIFVMLLIFLMGACFLHCILSDF